jgi:hypothetical protein
VCSEAGPSVTADSGRFCRLVCTELSCVFSSILPINLHNNKSSIWRISTMRHHKNLADIKHSLPHADEYAIFHCSSGGIRVGDTMNATHRICFNIIGPLTTCYRNLPHPLSTAKTVIHGYSKYQFSFLLTFIKYNPRDGRIFFVKWANQCIQMGNFTSTPHSAL